MGNQGSKKSEDIDGEFVFSLQYAYNDRHNSSI